MSKVIWVAGILILLCAIGGVYIITRPDTTPEPTSGIEGGNASVDANGSSEIVSYSATGFSPASITISPGTTVTWSNDADTDLWIVATGHENDVCSPSNTSSLLNECASISKGGSYSFTFTSPGTYTYINKSKPSDTGTITVPGDGTTSGTMYPNVIPM